MHVAVSFELRTSRFLRSLPKGRRHHRGVVIYDQPAPVGLYVNEAVPRRDGLRLAVLDVGGRVVAGVDSRVAIDTDKLVAEAHPMSRKDFERGDEVLSERG